MLFNVTDKVKFARITKFHPDTLFTYKGAPLMALNIYGIYIHTVNAGY